MNEGERDVLTRFGILFIRACDIVTYHNNLLCGDKTKTTMRNVCMCMYINITIYYVSLLKTEGEINYQIGG